MQDGIAGPEKLVLGELLLESPLLRSGFMNAGLGKGLVKAPIRDSHHLRDGRDGESDPVKPDNVVQSVHNAHYVTPGSGEGFEGVAVQLDRQRLTLIRLSPAIPVRS
jgi:hypothetical protein